MRIRATVLTPILAILTVAAIISTGIVLGQERHGVAATLLGATPVFATASTVDIAIVADVSPIGGAAGSTGQPSDQIPLVSGSPAVEPAPDQTGATTGAEMSPTAPAPTTQHSTDDDTVRRTTTTTQSEAQVQSAATGPTETDDDHTESDTVHSGDD